MQLTYLQLDFFHFSNGIVYIPIFSLRTCPAGSTSHFSSPPPSLYPKRQNHQPVQELGCIALALHLHCTCIALALQLHCSCIAVASCPEAWTEKAVFSVLFTLIICSRLCKTCISCRICIAQCRLCVDSEILCVDSV